MGHSCSHLHSHTQLLSSSCKIRSNNVVKWLLFRALNHVGWGREGSNFNASSWIGVGQLVKILYGPRLVNFRLDLTRLDPLKKLGIPLVDLLIHIYIIISNLKNVRIFSWKPSLIFHFKWRVIDIQTCNLLSCWLWYHVKKPT